MRPLLIALGGIFLLMAACGGQAEPSANQFAYIDPEGNIMLVNADGSGARKLGDPERCGRFPRLIWSPTGHRLACVGGRADGEAFEGFIGLIDAEGETIADLKLPGTVWPFYWSPSGEAFLYGVDHRYGVDRPLFLADDSGRSLNDLGSVDLSVAGIAQAHHGFALWSPDGSRLAYRPADAAEMRIYSLEPAGEQSFPGDYRPLAWALGGNALLVAAGYEPPVEMGYPDYEVNLLNLASQELTRLPDLDNGRQLWVSPDGTSAAVLMPHAEALPALAVLDFQSGQLIPIPDSVISYPSESIPGEHLTFSADGSQLYWLDGPSPTTIYRANADGTGLTKIVQLESLGAQFSPDLTLIAYQVFDDDSDTLTLYTANIDGTSAREIDRAAIGSGGFVFASAWRPAP
ncbi:MAG: hypothetical protein WBF66_03635 [Dehalococcoidia bacterium]